MNTGLTLRLTAAMFGAVMFIAGNGQAGTPEILSKLPVHTRGLLYAKDMQQWPVTKSGLQFLAGVSPQAAELLSQLTDEILIALIETGKGDHVVVLAGLRDAKITAQWAALRLLAAPLFTLPDENFNGVVMQKEHTLGFLRRGDGWIWFSNNEAVASAAAAVHAPGDKKNGQHPDRNQLTGNPLFQQALRASALQGKAFFYLDLEAGAFPLLNAELAGSHHAFIKRGLQGLGLYALRGVALSLDTGKGALLMDGSNAGLPALLFGQNAASTLLDRIPSRANYLRIPIRSGKDLLHLTHGVLGAIDPEIGQEMLTELEAFKQANGVDLVEEILAEIQREVIIYGGITAKDARSDMKGGLVCGLKNRAAFEKHLVTLFGLWEKAPVKEGMDEPKGRTLYIKGPIALGLDDDFFCLGNVAATRALLKDEATPREKRQPVHAASASLNVNELVSVAGAEYGMDWLAPLLRPVLPQQVTLRTTRERSTVLLDLDYSAATAAP